MCGKMFNMQQGFPQIFLNDYDGDYRLPAKSNLSKKYRYCSSKMVMLLSFCINEIVFHFPFAIYFLEKSRRTLESPRHNQQIKISLSV